MREETVHFAVLREYYSNCVPVLTYASDMKLYSSREMQNCTTALNNAIRKIFTYHCWESIRTLREAFGYKSFTEIFHISAAKFLKSLPNHSNLLIRELNRHLSVE